MTIAAQPERKRRARRIAADEAHAWARNLRLRNSLAKLVLSMLTGYVNGDGMCYVGIEALAEDTELSTDTVRKRLAWLEQVGAIARFPQWIDANGRRNGDGRGKRTSDEIRLMIHVDPDEIETRADGNGDGDSDVISPSPQQGQQTENEEVSPRPAPPLALGQPSDSGKGLDSSEHEHEESPLPPKGGEGRPNDAFDEAKEETWRRFQNEWQEPILRQSVARQVWWALTQAEEQQATKAAQGYVIWRARQKKPPNVINAHTFLREREAWAKFGELAPVERKSAQKVVVIRGCDTWNGVAVIKRIWKTGEPDEAVEVDAAAIPALKSLARLLDESDWRNIFEKRDPKQAQAWRERLHACGFRMPAAERIYTGEEHPVLGPKWESGWSLPCEWPPRMDGTVSTTGPPTPPTLSEEDNDALAQGLK